MDSNKLVILLNMEDPVLILLLLQQSDFSVALQMNVVMYANTWVKIHFITALL